MFLMLWAAFVSPDRGIFNSQDAPLQHQLGSGTYHKRGCVVVAQESHLRVGWFYRINGGFSGDDENLDYENPDAFFPPVEIEQIRLRPCEFCRPLSKAIWVWDVKVPDDEEGFFPLMEKVHGPILTIERGPWWRRTLNSLLGLVWLGVAIFVGKAVLGRFWGARNAL
jgi:hypothetical protein